MRPIDFDRAWEDQEDLESLCKDRPLETTEILAQNAFYGSDRVLKAYAGLPAEYALKIVIPHGVVLEPEGLSFLAPLERLPIVAYSPGDGEQLYRDGGIRNALWPLAMPYAYAVELARGTTGQERQRRGTIFFPSHSIRSELVDHDVAIIAARLRDLPREYQPVTVCIYFWDYLQGLGAAFTEQGFRVVSAGHQADPQFMIRLHHLIAAHRFASSDDIGSCCYYSMYSGCTYRHLGPVAGIDGAPPRTARFLEDLKRLSEGGEPGQRDAAAWMIGADKLLSPERLRAQLMAAECVDRWGMRAVRSEGGIRLRVERPWRPWLLRRWARARAGLRD